MGKEFLERVQRMIHKKAKTKGGFPVLILGVEAGTIIGRLTQCGNSMTKFFWDSDGKESSGIEAYDLVLPCSCS